MSFCYKVQLSGFVDETLYRMVQLSGYVDETLERIVDVRCISRDM